MKTNPIRLQEKYANSSTVTGASHELTKDMINGCAYFFFSSFPQSVSVRIENQVNLAIL